MFPIYEDIERAKDDISGLSIQTSRNFFEIEHARRRITDLEIVVKEMKEQTICLMNAVTQMQHANERAYHA